MFVRFATSTDAQAIAQIHVETWRAAYRGQIPDALLDGQTVEWRAAFWQERLTQAKGSVWVAEDGPVVGFCDFVPSRDEDAGHEVAEIAAIYVRAQHWGRGVGRALCESALADARRLGYKVVTLWVLASNDRARQFYEAMGFGLDGATKTKKTLDGSDLHEVRFRRAVG